MQQHIEKARKLLGWPTQRKLRPQPWFLKLLREKNQGRVR